MDFHRTILVRGKCGTRLDSRECGDLLKEQKHEFWNNEFALIASSFWRKNCWICEHTEDWIVLSIRPHLDAKYLQGYSSFRTSKQTCISFSTRLTWIQMFIFAEAIVYHAPDLYLFIFRPCQISITRETESGQKKDITIVIKSAYRSLWCKYTRQYRWTKTRMHCILYNSFGLDWHVERDLM